MFDFATILERTEKRVRDDLLGGGPKSVQELRSIHARITAKYQKQLERKKAHGQQMLAESLKKSGQNPDVAQGSPMDVANQVVNSATNVAAGAVANASTVAAGATAMAVGVLSQIKPPSFNPLGKSEENNIASSQTFSNPPDLLSGSMSAEDGDWVQTSATDGVAHFSIDDDDDL